MATIGVGVLDDSLAYAEVLGQRTLETSRVEGCKCSNLVGLQTRVNESYEAGDVGGVEDNHAELGIGAELLDVLTKLLGSLRVAYEQVFTCHALLTGCAT